MQTGKKTIYLHIGMPKSGTTSIQSFLYENREKLSSEQNLLYPLINSEGQNSIDKKINYRTIMVDAYYRHSKNIKYYNKFFEEKFLKQIEESKCEKIVFSEECIFMYCPDTQIIDVFIKHCFNVKVIVYLRKPSEYIASLWQENLKPYMDDFHYSIEEFAQNTYINYPLILKFIDKLGKDNVIVRPFEKEQWKNNNLIEDFLSATDINNFDTGSFPVVNSSYNRNLAEFMLLLKGTGIPRCELVKLLKEYMKHVVPNEKLPVIDSLSDYDFTEFIAENSPVTPRIIDTLPDKFIEDMHNRYDEILNKIAQVYGKENMFLNKYPNCYGKERAEYDGLILSYSQLNLLQKAMSL